MSVIDRPAPSPTGRAPRGVEVKGPSALGGGLRRFAYLAWTIAITDFRLTYFGSALGYVWSLMRPLLTFGVMFLVFSQALKLGGGIYAYPVLLLFNIVLVSFFQEATGLSVTALISRESLVRKTHFPLLVIPVAVVLTSTLNFALNLIAVFVFLLAYGITPTLGWLGLVPLIALLVMVTSGVAMLVSALHVRFRDVGQIWGVISQALFYGSLVFFTIERVPSLGLRRLVLANPLAALLQQGRHWIVDPHAQSLASAMGGGWWVLLPAGVGVGLCALGYIVYSRQAPRIAELL